MLTHERIIQKLTLPEGKIDIVIDTDTFNEVDDQFALVYALRSIERLNVKTIYATPFFNKRSSSPADGMEKSYDEILRVLNKMDYSYSDDFVKKGSTRYLKSVDTPCESEAAADLIERAMTSEKPLYVVAIGAITNIASALLIEPKIAEKIVVVWLGGHAFHWENTNEFNLKQDVVAANVVFNSGVPLVLLPCKGVVSHLSTTLPEIKANIDVISPIGSYLTGIVRDYAFGKKVYSKVIWDAAAIAYLMNPEWVKTRFEPSPKVTNDLKWSFNDARHPIAYAYDIDRDAILSDLFDKINSIK